jgi:hypothetical protein
VDGEPSQLLVAGGPRPASSRSEGLPGTRRHVLELTNDEEGVVKRISAIGSCTDVCRSLAAPGDLRRRRSATRDGTLQFRTEGIEESVSGHSEFGQQSGVRVAVQVDPIGQTPGQGLGSVGSVGTAEYLECLSLRENSHRASFRDDVVECPRCSPAGRHRPRPPHSTTRHGWCELPERRRAATGWLSTRSIRHAVAGAAASGMVLLPVGNVRSGHFVPIADLRSPGFGLRPAHLERAHACHSSPRRHR